MQSIERQRARESLDLFHAVSLAWGGSKQDRKRYLKDLQTVANWSGKPKYDPNESTPLSEATKKFIMSLDVPTVNKGT